MSEDEPMPNRRPTNDISDIPGSKPVCNIKPLKSDELVSGPSDRSGAAGTGGLTSE